MPVEFNIVLQNGTVSKYYIPTVLMRGEKEVELNTKILSEKNVENQSVNMIF